MNNWTEIVKQIKASENVVIMTHTNMDGDAMGSASALCHAVRDLGKNCVILLEDNIPGYLQFMHSGNFHEGSLPFYVHEMPFEADLAIAVDCGDESRIEKRLDVYKKAAKTICVDHHMQTEHFADYSYVDPDSAAAGILVYDLINELGVTIDRDIAEDLYTAILTDTGCFRFSNTDARSHEVVAQLYKAGIRHSEIGTLVYDSNPLPQVLLEARIIDWMEVFADGKAVISYVTKGQMDEMGATYDMGGTCIDRLRKVRGVEICAFLKENANGVIKASLRAKSYADVNRVARALGGGGHEKSSGCSFTVPMEEALELVKAEIVKELNRPEYR